MSPMPEWLPPMASVDGVWEDTLQNLYNIFVDDFKRRQPRLDTQRVRWDRRVLEGDKEEGFWHLITRTEKQSGERLPDLRRAERLPWCPPTINNARDISVKLWIYREGNGRLHTYIWLEDWDYVIVFDMRTQRIGNVFFLLTAYHVDGKNQRRHLKGKYAKREP